MSRLPDEDSESRLPDNSTSGVKRPRPDLQTIFSSLSTAGDTLSEAVFQPVGDVHSLSGQSSPSGNGGNQTLPKALLEEVQQYLPADLYRRLCEPVLPRGVLLNALERLRSLQYQISTYLPGNLVQEKIRRPVTGLVTGQWIKGTLLFSDVSGFTALSESLSRLDASGAEFISGIINRYFSTMHDILSCSGGILIKYAGDATLSLFPDQGGEQANWALRAGLRMLQAMKQFRNLETPVWTIDLGMKVGIATGEMLAASVGTAERMEYALLGETVERTLKAEGMSSPGKRLIVDEVTQRFISSYSKQPVGEGFFNIVWDDSQPLDDFEIKPEQRRTRSAIPINATSQALAGQMEVVLRQIQALAPYLAAEITDKILAQSRTRNLASEYRPTTVMFCNFEGPELLLKAWGQDGVRRVTSLLSAYFSEMNEVITRYGGIVSRIDPYTRGTKLLALFGAPVAHEDDPQRAVSAALAMNTELNELNRHWIKRLNRHLPEDRWSELIRHRIGITQGIAFAGQAGSATRREYTVMGDEVNLAARLMATAEWGQVLVSQPVWEAVSEHFIIHNLPPVRVKGKSKPVSLYLVQGNKGDALLRRALARDPLLGRAVELEKCRSILKRVQSGKAGALTLQGPAGIGKSHLADAFIKQAHGEGFRILAFQSRAYLADEPYSCWREMIYSLAGISSDDYPQVRQDKFSLLMKDLNIDHNFQNPLSRLAEIPLCKDPSIIESAGGDGGMEARGSEDEYFNQIKQGQIVRRNKHNVPDIFSEYKNLVDGSSAHEVDSPLAKSSSGRFVHVVEAIQALLDALLLCDPLLVFIEDATFMDKASFNVIKALLPRMENRQIMFLFATRGEDDKKSCLGEVLHLELLNLQDTSSMVAHILTDGLSELIHEQSNGNPLFIEEITRWIRNTRKISADDLRDVLRSSDILRVLMLSSLEDLTEEQREILRVASVVGIDFCFSEIQAMIFNSIPSRRLSHLLYGLIGKHIIIQLETGVDARFAFRQTLMRDVVYQSLPLEKRQELHAHLADSLSAAGSRRQLHDRISALTGVGGQTTPGLTTMKIANHYALAEKWLEAARYYTQSAGLLKHGSMGSEQKVRYTNAMKCLAKADAENPSREVDLLATKIYLGMGDVNMSESSYPDAVENYQNALAKCVDHDESHLTMDVHLRLSLAYAACDKFVEADQHLVQVENCVDAEENLAVVLIRAWLDWRMNRKTAGKEVENALEILEKVNDPGIAGLKAAVFAMKEKSSQAIHDMLVSELFRYLSFR